MMKSHRSEVPETASRIIREIVAIEAIRAGLSPDYVMSHGKGSHGRAHRHPLRERARGCIMIAAYVAHTTFQIEQSHIAAVLGYGQQRISFMCRQVEDCRDDQHTDRWIDTIEKAMQHLTVNRDAA
jgi:hypothetical protein